MTDFIAHPDHGLAWITGASSGIGRALAKRLAEEGFGVVVTARDLDRLLELQTEVAASGADGRIIVLDGDVTDPRDMERASTCRSTVPACTARISRRPSPSTCTVPSIVSCLSWRI